MRLAPSQNKPQARAWHLNGGPASWDAADATACLKEVGCQEVAVLPAPRKTGPWLVRCIPPSDAFFGFVAIEAGDFELTLTQVPGGAKPRRSVSERIPFQKDSKKGSGLNPWPPVPELPKVAAVDVAMLGNTGVPVPPLADSQNKEDEKEEEKDRSRSPLCSVRTRAKHAEMVNNLCDLVDCGGGSRCGYNVLACALALRSGKTLASFQNNLVAMGRTARNDVYQHMDKHQARYCPWSSTDRDTNENNSKWQHSYQLGGILTSHSEVHSMVVRTYFACGLASFWLAHCCD